MANGANLTQMDERYWRSSRRLLRGSSADLDVILGGARAPDVTSLTKSSCRLLESARPFSKLHYNKMYFIHPQSTEKVSVIKQELTARVGWRLPVWLRALSRLGSNDKEMQKEALQQVAAGPPKAAKRKHRGIREHLRSKPKHYRPLAFLSEFGLSDVLMESLYKNFEESNSNFASKAHAGFASFSDDVMRSRGGVPDEMRKAVVEESNNSHVKLKNMNSVDKRGEKKASRNQMRVGGIAALFISRGNNFRVQSQIPIASDPKSFLDCSYLRLRPKTVLSLEEDCRKRGIEPRPHRHMTDDQLLEYYDQLNRRPATSDDGERVLKIWNRDD